MDEAIFPLEIFGIIVETFSQSSNEDIRALRNCCLVCKDFVPLCRQQLFYHIDINIRRGISVSRKRLIEVLQRNPRVSSYVKRVRYTLNSKSEEALIIRGGRSSYRSSIYMDCHSPSLHTFFPNIRCLIITHKPHKPHHVPEPCHRNECYKLSTLILRDFSLHPSLTTLSISCLVVALQRVLDLRSMRQLFSRQCEWQGSYVPPRTQPNMTSFSLRELFLMPVSEFPVDILRYCPHLSVINCTAIDDPGVFSARDFLLASSSSLQEVVVYQNVAKITTHDTRSVSRLCDPAEATGDAAFPALLTLDVAFGARRTVEDSEGENEGVCKIVRHAPNLEDLCLYGFEGWQAATSSGLQLNRCLTKTLRTLYLYCSSCGPSLELFPVADLCSAFSNIKHSSALEKVHILLMRQSMGDIDEWMEAWMQDWRVFDDLLAGNPDSNFQKLQKAEVEFYGSEDLVDTFWSRALVELPSFTFSFERSHVFPSYILTFLRRTT